VYLVTDRSLTRGRPLASVVEAAVRGGATCVQLREKELDTNEFLEQALVLARLLEPLGIPLVINDNVEVALACRASGLHLGQGDLSPGQARQLLPPEMFIGWSVETAADVMLSASMPVDYLGVSPVFATPTKTDTKAPWGLAGLRQARALTALPLVAIGGIHSGNAGDGLRAGADGLAVVSAICAADDPAAAARELRWIGSSATWGIDLP
jgi:thiamine-phosphate pyrophosphorylase